MPISEPRCNEAEDHDLRAWTLAWQSLLPTSRSDHKTALELLDSALLFAMHGPALTRLAWVAALKAGAHAGLKEIQNFHEALGIAEDAMSRSDGLGCRPGTDFFDRLRLDGIKGACLSRTGQPQEAQRILHHVLAERDASHVKGRALIKFDLASAYIQDSQLEYACTLTAEALGVPAEVRVDPIVRRARDVRGELEPWNATQAVRELDEFVHGLGITFGGAAV